MHSTTVEHSWFFRPLSAAGWSSVLGTGPLSLSQVYELTIVTWRDGRETRIPISVHSAPGMLVVFLACLILLCAHVCLVVLAIRFIVEKHRGYPVRRSNLML